MLVYATPAVSVQQTGMPAILTAHPAALLLLLILLQPPDCDPSKDCGSWVVYPYFLSFVVLVTIIMLQLFTAVIIESFEAQEEQDVSAEQCFKLD
jgi:hypothetical protein